MGADSRTLAMQRSVIDFPAANTMIANKIGRNQPNPSSSRILRRSSAHTATASRGTPTGFHLWAETPVHPEPVVLGSSGLGRS